VTITATSRAWDDTNEPDYKIVSPPQHGALEPIAGTDQAIYTPAEGYTGPDSYTFSASDPNSEFPRDPAVATISIDVGAARTPTVAISGAPADMVAGTSVQLSTVVTNDSPNVTWSAGAGAITSGGLYTAPSTPPAGGVAVIAARSSKGAQAQVAIAIRPAPAAAAAPAVGSSAHCKFPSHPQGVCRPEAMLIGRKLIITTRVSKAGRIRLSAYLGHRLLGTCAAKTLADRSFTCRLTLGKHISLNAHIAIVATLRVGGKVLSNTRPAERVPEMKMAGPSRRPTTKRVLAGKASSWRFWCEPSMGM
jgi:hypothetical protein